MKSIGVTLQRTYLRKNCKKKYFVTSSYLTSLVDITLFSITPNSFYNVIHWTCQSNFDSSDEKTTARKNYCTIFSFFKRPEKMAFPKKSCWNLIFLVLSGKIIFLFPENMIWHLRQKMKDDLSQKNTRKYDIFFKVSEKMVFSKRAAPGHDLSCIIWKDGIFSRKHDIFSLGRRSETTLLKKYMEIWYFLSTRMGVTNVVSRPSAKKIKDGLIPQKCFRLTS